MGTCLLCRIGRQGRTFHISSPPTGTLTGGGKNWDAKAFTGAFGSVERSALSLKDSGVRSHVNLRTKGFSFSESLGHAESSRWPDWNHLPTGVSGLSAQHDVVQSRRVYGPVRVFAKEAARPSLDDVERLSKGKPSKSKMGSRAVPHRLTQAERKVSGDAFEFTSPQAILSTSLMATA